MDQDAETVLLPEEKGGELSASMIARAEFRETLSRIRPYGTWIVCAVMVIAYVLQLSVLNSRTTLGLVGLGANASVLVGRGEWYRLVTASLLQGTTAMFLPTLAGVLVIGTMAERLLGCRHMLIVFLTGCLVSQMIAAAWGSAFDGFEISVGALGGLLSVVGALLTVSTRYDAQLSGEYRLGKALQTASRFGLVYVLIFLIRMIAHVAGLTGLACGVLAGCLLVRGKPDVASIRRAGWLTNDMFAALLLVFALAIAAGLQAAPAAREADRLTFSHRVAASKAASSTARGKLAAEIADLPDASPALLRQGSILASQALEGLMQKNTDGSNISYALDTDARLFSRLGDRLTAVDAAARLPWNTQPFTNHLILLLADLAMDGEPAVLGETGPEAPSISLAGGVLHVLQGRPARQGARAYVLVQRPDGPAGVLLIILPPGFSGAQILPLPTAMASPAQTIPALWTDGKSSLRLALFDRRGCYCDWPAMGPYFAAYATGGSVSP
jgi:membrane associated rhomboid family serine protease